MRFWLVNVKSGHSRIVVAPPAQKQIVFIRTRNRVVRTSWTTKVKVSNILDGQRKYSFGYQRFAQATSRSVSVNC